MHKTLFALIALLAVSGCSTTVLNSERLVLQPTATKESRARLSDLMDHAVAPFGMYCSRTLFFTLGCHQKEGKYEGVDLVVTAQNGVFSLCFSLSDNGYSPQRYAELKTAVSGMLEANNYTIVERADNVPTERCSSIDFAGAPISFNAKDEGSSAPASYVVPAPPAPRRELQVDPNNPKK